MTSSTVLQFLDRLVSVQKLNPEALSRILAAMGKTGQPVDIILRELGLLPDMVIAEQLAEACGYRGTAVIEYSAKTAELLAQLGSAFAIRKAVLPSFNSTGPLKLVVANPFDSETIESVRYFFDCSLEIVVAPRTLITDTISAWERLMETEAADQSIPEILSGDDLERLQDIARDAPVVHLVNKIIQQAVDENASDIHIEPEANRMRVRFRKDGLLSDRDGASFALYVGVISRLKILGRLNIAERRLPQDGRIRLSVRGQEVDFRLSIVPSIHGETAVLRILDRQTVKLDLAALGFDEAATKTIERLSELPNGLFLVTGPTGSGKTTTLYAILSQLKRPELKIFTVEDPVEYRIPGVTQLQVDPAIGLTFASALRSVLRQDPDVILLGEIRDQETAQIAVQAALTGHLILSTLHTNSAAGAFGRLGDIGIEPFMLEATVRCVIGQRLVRKCCSSCQAAPGYSCETCGGTGYRGRQTTFEILEMNAQLRELVRNSRSEHALQTEAQLHGMVLMRDHARSLVSAGLTTEAEALRVVELEERL